MHLTQQLMNVMSQTPQFRSVISDCGVGVSTLPDGTVVHLNSTGRVIQAQYSTGVKVRRSETTCLVQTIDGSYWLSDCSGRWYALD